LQPAQARWLLIPEQVQQLDTLARQIAIALERVHYVDIAQQAVVEMESERLRNALLAAISHDVRTPLTALIGLAESLAAVCSRRCLRAGRYGTRPMNNRPASSAPSSTTCWTWRACSSGVVNLRMEWQSAEEVVGSAIRAAAAGAGGKPVRHGRARGLAAGGV
jgi:two-component system sensor histidine kinase KdpD